MKRNEDLEQFEKWQNSKTEFTQPEFFQAVRDALKGYEVEEAKPGNDHSLMFVGETVEQDISTTDTHGIWHPKKERLKFKLEIVYHEDMCHITYSVHDKGKIYCGSSPFKTYDDLSHVATSLWTKELVKTNRERHVQMSLFDF